MMGNGITAARVPILHGAAAGRDLENGFISDRRAFLWKKPKRNAPLKSDLTFVRRVVAKNQREEGGFSCAVRSNETDTVLAIHGKGNVGEQSASAEALADAGNREHEAQSVDATTARRKWQDSTSEREVNETLNLSARGWERLQ